MIFPRIFQELWAESKFLVDQHYYRYWNKGGKEGKERKGKLWRNRFSAYPVCCETKQASKQMTGSGPSDRWVRPTLLEYLQLIVVAAAVMPRKNYWASTHYCTVPKYRYNPLPSFYPVELGKEKLDVISHRGKREKKPRACTKQAHHHDHRSD